VPHVPMPEGVALSRDLPDWVRLAIADAVVVFGRLEQEAVEIAWLLKGADLKQKLKLARNPAQENLTFLVAFIERAAPGLKLDAMKDAIAGAAYERNLIAHGSWSMANRKPWVVWHKFLEDDDSVIGEFFERPRFERFMKITGRLLADFLRYHSEFESLTGKKTTSVPRA